MDWVPIANYGDGVTVTSNSVLEVPLFAPGQYNLAAVEGRYEDSDEYFIHRIVGQFRWTLVEASTPSDCGFRVWPGLIDPITTTVLTPANGANAFQTNGNATITNARFWAEQRQTVDSEFDDPSGPWSSLAHPFWSLLDIKPRQKLGVLEVPALTLWNIGVTNCVWEAYWRMLVSKAGRR